MPIEPKNYLQDEIAQLRREFHEQLILEMAELARLASLSDEYLLATDTLKHLHDTVHRLAGSALTFGYQITGEGLREFEQALYQLMENDATLTPAQIRLELRELASGLTMSSTPVKTLLADNAVDASPCAEENLHIYLLEDSPSTSEMLKPGLASFGYHVSAFTSITALTEAALHEQPDALIIETEKSSFSDQALSSAVSTMRKHGMASTPIIIISEQHGFEQKLQAARHGVAAFVSKPVDIPALESTLDYILQQKIKSPYRILLVDDDPYSGEHHKLMLGKWGIVARSLSEPEQILSVIDEFHPDLMIFDLHMPCCSGIELAEVVRYHTHWIHIPIIFLSSERSESKQLLAMMHGGDDFIVKPVIEENFVATVRSRAKRARQLAELMTRDSLTGLFKHTEIKERLAHEFARARRNKTAVALAMIDIDKFKNVNDTYGHPAGDVVIATLAHLLKRGLRTTDIVGRYGGEEYLVIMPDTSAENAARKLNLLREEFATIVFRHKDAAYTCTFSGGVCASINVDNTDSFVECADQALYAAKEGGRNQIRLSFADLSSHSL